MAIEDLGRVHSMGSAGKRTKRIDADALKHFGRELDRWVREKYEGNQTAAGRALGVSQGHISAMIQGTRGPGLPTLIALRDKTGRSIDELLGFEKSKTPPAVNAPLPAELPDGKRVLELLKATVAAMEQSEPPPPMPKKSEDPQVTHAELPRPRPRRRA